MKEKIVERRYVQSKEVDIRAAEIKSTHPEHYGAMMVCEQLHASVS